MPYVHIFFYLQLLDLLTTLIGLNIGASEASPFIRMLMNFGPAVGVFASKMVAVAIAIACIRLQRRHVIRWVSYWYAGLVMWNLFVILAANPALRA
ncbi:MAG: DUF5658 family protein [Bryobacteraceae bacterium]